MPTIGVPRSHRGLPEGFQCFWEAFQDLPEAQWSERIESGADCLGYPQLCRIFKFYRILDQSTTFWGYILIHFNIFMVIHVKFGQKIVKILIFLEFSIKILEFWGHFWEICQYPPLWNFQNLKNLIQNRRETPRGWASASTKNGYKNSYTTTVACAFLAQTAKIGIFLTKNLKKWPKKAIFWLFLDILTIFEHEIWKIYYEKSIIFA